MRILLQDDSIMGRDMNQSPVSSLCFDLAKSRRCGGPKEVWGPQESV
jgi:hypothetical protein